MGRRYAVRNTKRGFTLLEILLTLVLFGAGVVGVAGLFGYALDNSLDAEYTEIATGLAQAKMEVIDNNSVVSQAKGPVGGLFTQFQRSVTVDTLTTPKTITVTVFWTFKNQETSISLVSYALEN